MGFFRRNRDANQSPAEVYKGLRRQVLELRPEQLGAAVPADSPIVALVMETGYPEAVATLVGVADGTTSLYFSNGGGIIGAGAHASVEEASRRWLDSAANFLTQLAETADPGLPAEGMTQFIAVTPDGLRAAVAPEADLGSGSHALSPLFHAGHDVITQIRLAESD